jgi:hypothetical protein
VKAQLKKTASLKIWIKVKNPNDRLQLANWNKRIRTFEWPHQKRLPCHLAMLQKWTLALNLKKTELTELFWPRAQISYKVNLITAAARTKKNFSILTIADLNCLPPGCKPGALPVELIVITNLCLGWKDVSGFRNQISILLRSDPFFFVPKSNKTFQLNLKQALNFSKTWP